MTSTWLITGASSGFGRALTEKFLARGDRVAATVRRPETLDDLKAEYGDRLWIARLDLRAFDAVRETVDRAFAELGRIDGVISNAGYGLLGAIEETDDAQLRDMMDTNLLGSIVLIRSVLPHLRAQGGGHVMQVSSEGGQTTYPGFSAYHATKWGIEGFVESTAKDVEPFGVRFTLVEPGATRTNFAVGVVLPDQLANYAGTPAHLLREAALGGGWVIKGDVDRMTDHIIAIAGQPEPPLRLLMGAEAYDSVHAALTGRLQALEAQREIAVSSDFTDAELQG